MRYTDQIQRALIDQIEREPGRVVILPDWAHWKKDAQPWVYIDNIPTRLIRHLYTIVIGDLSPDSGLINPPGIDPRNVNPYLAIVTPCPRCKPFCRNGHRYTDEVYVEGVGRRCKVCHNRGERQISNKAKKVCPKGHRLLRRENGRRRCRECDAERWQARRNREKESKE